MSAEADMNTLGPELMDFFPLKYYLFKKYQESTVMKEMPPFNHRVRQIEPLFTKSIKQTRIPKIG